jgi:hypothetical protein
LMNLSLSLTVVDPKHFNKRFKSSKITTWMSKIMTTRKVKKIMIMSLGSKWMTHTMKIMTIGCPSYLMVNQPITSHKDSKSMKLTLQGHSS